MTLRFEDSDSWHWTLAPLESDPFAGLCDSVLPILHKDEFEFKWVRDGTIFYTLGSLLDAAIWERGSNPRVDQSLLTVAGAESISLERFPLTRFDAKKYTILKLWTIL